MSNSDEPASTLAIPVQQPLPLAFVNGEAVIEKPEDLYIPPEALEVILESFEGPLDLLLYLIRKQKFDITTMPVAEITRQYMEYVEVMQTLKLELAAEYLLMAAILAEIKSRLLLPSRSDEDDDEEDPRAALIRRLQEYELIKQAAEDLDLQPRMERDLFSVSVEPSADIQPVIIQPDVSLQELVLAFSAAMQRAAAFEHHHIAPEALSTRERMSKILQLHTFFKNAQASVFRLYIFKKEQTKTLMTSKSIFFEREALIQMLQNFVYATQKFYHKFIF